MSTCNRWIISSFLTWLAFIVKERRVLLFSLFSFALCLLIELDGPTDQGKLERTMTKTWFWAFERRDPREKRCKSCATRGPSSPAPHLLPSLHCSRAEPTNGIKFVSWIINQPILLICSNSSSHSGLPHAIMMVPHTLWQHQQQKPVLAESGVASTKRLRDAFLFSASLFYCTTIVVEKKGKANFKFSFVLTFGNNVCINQLCFVCEAKLNRFKTLSSSLVQWWVDCPRVKMGERHSQLTVTFIHTQ